MKIGEADSELFSSRSEDYEPLSLPSYSQISKSGKSAAGSERMLKELKEKNWRILLLDEAQVVLANDFSVIIVVIKAHCKTCLTSTLLRKDEKIGDIKFCSSLLGFYTCKLRWDDDLIDPTSLLWLVKSFYTLSKNEKHNLHEVVFEMASEDSVS